MYAITNSKRSKEGNNVRETYENGGCIWEVINRYQLTDEYMQEHRLYSRDRITVRCLKGNDNISPGFVMDFATPAYLGRR